MVQMGRFLPAASGIGRPSPSAGYSLIRRHGRPSALAGVQVLGSWVFTKGPPSSPLRRGSGKLLCKLLKRLDFRLRGKGESPRMGSCLPNATAPGRGGQWFFNLCLPVYLGRYPQSASAPCCCKDWLKMLQPRSFYDCGFAEQLPHMPCYISVHVRILRVSGFFPTNQRLV